MFVAQSKTTGKLIRLPGASSQFYSYATVVGPTEVAAMVSDLRCLRAGCTQKLHLNNGSTVCGIRAHLKHDPAPNGQAPCDGSSGESDWHLFVKLGLLAGAYGHEIRTADGSARCDAAVMDRNAVDRYAIEVQHSASIGREAIARRHAAHQRAGYRATVWFIDATEVLHGRIDADAWAGRDFTGQPLDKDYSLPGIRTIRGRGRSIAIEASWLIDLIAEAQSSCAAGYPVVVGLMVEDPIHGLVTRMVSEAEEFDVVNGAGHVHRTGVLRKLKPPISENAIRRVATGPALGTVKRTDPDSGGITALTAALRTRTLGPIAGGFVDIDTRITAAGEARGRLSFTGHHEGFVTAATALGLKQRERAGYMMAMAGPLTPGVREWLAREFEYSLPERIVA